MRGVTPGSRVMNADHLLGAARTALESFGDAFGKARHIVRLENDRNIYQLQDHFLNTAGKIKDVLR
jgi:hypothetical protein